MTEPGGGWTGGGRGWPSGPSGVPSAEVLNIGVTLAPRPWPVPSFWAAACHR